MSGLTELVGREEELELLLRRWSKAKTGEGQVALLSMRGWDRQIAATAAAILERFAGMSPTLRAFDTSAPPQHTDSALLPHHQ